MIWQNFEIEVIATKKIGKKSAKSTEVYFFTVDGISFEQVTVQAERYFADFKNVYLQNHFLKNGKALFRLLNVE